MMFETFPYKSERCCSQINNSVAFLQCRIQDFGSGGQISEIQAKAVNSVAFVYLKESLIKLFFF